MIQGTLADTALLSSLKVHGLKQLASQHNLLGLNGKTKGVYVERLLALRKVTVTEASHHKVADAPARRLLTSGAAAKGHATRERNIRGPLQAFLDEGGADELSCSKCGHRLQQVVELKMRNSPGRKLLRVTCGRYPACKHTYFGMKLDAAHDILREIMVPRVSLEVTSLRRNGNTDDLFAVGTKFAHAQLLLRLLDCEVPRVEMPLAANGATVLPQQPMCRVRSLLTPGTHGKVVDKEGNVSYSFRLRDYRTVLAALEELKEEIEAAGDGDGGDSPGVGAAPATSKPTELVRLRGLPEFPKQERQQPNQPETMLQPNQPNLRLTPATQPLLRGAATQPPLKPCCHAASSLEPCCHAAMLQPS